ncbi:sugar phosphate isomerase/epimerase family protein [Flexithrix dorotheae]|uniref:sugar phosphate isomerase/epimerase family protein n=1 Tax=Flexithrix dorotheae TaxID=70993 RepID=UPI0003604E6E|nr:sugar phosphate isomerase/epimerase family protein [Flexithrix dorotheae]
MVKIGFNVLAWSAVNSEDLIPILDRIKEIGYDGVEFLIGSPDIQAYQKLGKHAQDIELETTSVFVLSESENLVSSNQSIRKSGLDRIKWAVDRAQELNSEIICGPFHSALGVFSGKAPEEQEYKWSAEILHEAGEYAAQANVVFAMEALNRFECYLCNTMQQLIHLVEMTDHPNVQAMFDTHHANIEEKNISEAINLISPNLKHVHISENDRGTPGDGHVPWDEVFSSLSNIDYKGWLTIEGFTRNDPDFANALKVWREFAQPWDMAEEGLKFIRSMVEKHTL